MATVTMTQETFQQRGKPRAVVQDDWEAWRAGGAG
jgi:hypothetical protein